MPVSYELFAANRLFHGLEPEALRPMFSRGQILRVPAGEVLVEQGQTHEHLYLVLSGRAEVGLLDPREGAPVRLAELGAGDCFGEYGLVDERPASATVTTLEESELFRIPNRDFKAVLLDHTFGVVVYRHLLETLVARLRACNENLDRPS